MYTHQGGGVSPYIAKQNQFIDNLLGIKNNVAITLHLIYTAK